MNENGSDKERYCIICKNKIDENEGGMLFLDYFQDIFTKEDEEKYEEDILCHNCYNSSKCEECEGWLEEHEMYILFMNNINLKECIDCTENDEYILKYYDLKYKHYNIDTIEKINNINEFLHNNRFNNINDLEETINGIIMKNKILEYKNEKLIKENDFLRKQNKDIKELNEKQNNKNNCHNIIGDSIENNVEYLNIKENIKDNYLEYLFSENEDQKRKRIKNNLRKNILKNKCLSILKEDKTVFIDLKNKRDEKMINLRNRFKKKIIKSKAIICLRNLSDDKKYLNKIIETINKYKNKLQFDDTELQKCAINNNRTKIDFFATLYDKKEISKNISDKDFKLAVEEYHPDKNITRITRISKICFYLRKNNVIWNSNVIFKSLYIFQYVEDYKIDYLIEEIENVIQK